MGQRIIGVEFHCLFKLANRAFNASRRTLDHQISAPQVCIMSLGICCRNHPGCCPNLESQMLFQGLNDVRRDFILNRENVIKRPVVGF